MARKSKTPPPDTIWEIPDDLWDARELILDEPYPKKPTGRPRANLRPVLDAIVFRMRRGCQWNKLPERYGSDSTAHRWFQRFCQDGIFEGLWGLLVETCEDWAGVYWDWPSADSRLGKARYGGKRWAKTPPIAAKPARKPACRSMSKGGPLGVVIDAANVPDCKLLEATIEAIVVARPEPTAESPQHLCLDQGYDNPTGQQAASAGGHTPHIRRIGEEKKACDQKKGQKPRRGVMERTLSGLCKCRAILVRYDKHARNYLGLMEFACAM